MKKLLLGILGLVAFSGVAHAGPEDFNYIPYSSYSDVATPGTVLLTSCPIQIAAIMLSSGATNGSITLYRSTTPVFTADISTQTVIGTDFLTFNTGPLLLPLGGFEIKNESYTYINKQGAAKVTMFIRCFPNKKGQRVGLCPGLPTNGSMFTKIEFQ